MKDKTFDCDLCIDKDRCDWRIMTDALRYQDCEDYNPMTIKDIKHDNNR